jgi:tetratricopeptide (TPR) repeat protein
MTARVHRPRQRRIAPFFAILLVGNLHLGVAHADADAGEPAEYRPLIEEALREYGNQHFEEAEALFQRAHQLFPNARTLRGLGLVAFERRDYADCIRLLREALEAAPRPLEGMLRTETEQVLRRAEGFVGSAWVELVPLDAQLRVDGIATALLPQPLMLVVGDHHLEARRSGYVSDSQTITVRANGSVRVSMTLTPSPTPELLRSSDQAAPSTATSAPPSEARPWTRSPWLWTAAGLVVAAGAAGAAIAFTRGSALRADGGSTGETLEAP